MRVSYKMRFRPTKNDDDENLLAFIYAREWRWMRLNGDDTYEQEEERVQSSIEKLSILQHELSVFSTLCIQPSSIIYFAIHLIYYE